MSVVNYIRFPLRGEFTMWSEPSLIGHLLCRGLQPDPSTLPLGFSPKRHLSRSLYFHSLNQLQARLDFKNNNNHHLPNRLFLFLSPNSKKMIVKSFLLFFLSSYFLFFQDMEGKMNECYLSLATTWFGCSVMEGSESADGKSKAKWRKVKKPDGKSRSRVDDSSTQSAWYFPSYYCVCVCFTSRADDRSRPNNRRLMSS